MSYAKLIYSSKLPHFASSMTLLIHLARFSCAGSRKSSLSLEWLQKLNVPEVAGQVSRCSYLQILQVVDTLYLLFGNLCQHKFVYFPNVEKGTISLKYTNHVRHLGHDFFKANSKIRYCFLHLFCCTRGSLIDYMKTGDPK